MSEKTKAAAMGGLGCLAAFVAFAIVAVLFGGSAYIDGGGVVLLLIIGAVLGLAYNSIYQKGKRDARRD